MTYTLKLGRGTTLVLAVSLAAVGVTGCKHLENPGTKVAAWNLVDAAQRHPILVSQQPTEMTVSISAGQHHLSPHHRAQVHSFVQRFRATDAGNGRIVISAPSGSRNEVAAMHAVSEIRKMVASIGVSDTDVIVEAYQGEPGRNLPIRLSFLRFVAEGPTCGNFSTNLAEEPGNLPYPNFGCSTQKILAAQVANPADLLEPRAMTPRASGRRDVTFNGYIKGEVTGADKSDDERVNLQDLF